MATSKQGKVPRKEDQRFDHVTKTEASLPRKLRCHCSGNQDEPALGAAPLQDSLSVLAVLVSFIAPEIEVSQRWALPKHFRNILCPGCFKIKIAAEIKGTVSALLQVSLYLVSSFSLFPLAVICR